MGRMTDLYARGGESLSYMERQREFLEGRRAQQVCDTCAVGEAVEKMDKRVVALRKAANEIGRKKSGWGTFCVLFFVVLLTLAIIGAGMFFYEQGAFH